MVHAALYESVQRDTGGKTVISEKEIRKALDELQERIDLYEKHYRGTVPEYYDALKTAVEALEKQIQKKPNYEGDGCDKYGNIILDTWICPCCGCKYEVDYDNYNHCPECGQRIDWEDSHE